MADRKLVQEQDETPEDVATLYSWANLHGAKYRDFSASRAQTRERARQRVQEAIEAERRRAREEAEARRAVEAKTPAEKDKDIIAEPPRKQQQPEIVEREAQRGDWHSDRNEHRFAPEPAGQPLYVPPVERPGDYAQRSRTAAPHQGEKFHEREDLGLRVRSTWTSADAKEVSARPAWLEGDRADASCPSLPAAVPEDTLQGSRERLASRWFALHGLFTGAAPSEAAPAPAPQRVPVLAVFSLAGGVGKTSLVATLGRALSACGERVLLVDTASFGLLPFFFGARDQRPGVLRTFAAPGANSDAPIQMITIDAETLGPEAGPQETLTQEILRDARGVSRVIVDLATASGAITRRILRLSPTVLVPVVPDMNSVVSVASIESFFQHNLSASGQPVRPFYVLDRFDSSLPLHLDVREVLRQQLGDRLLPFVLRRTSAVSEALAEGMTVVDYAPHSPVSEDFDSLAQWIKNISAPATNGYRGVRWSER